MSLAKAISIRTVTTVPATLRVLDSAWRYSVTVTDASGYPLSGTVDIEFVFAGMVGGDLPPTAPALGDRARDGSFPRCGYSRA